VEVGDEGAGRVGVAGKVGKLHGVLPSGGVP
jgi:hypothetical protein